jgi:uncharacterized protein (TIGR00251 family)
VRDTPRGATLVVRVSPGGRANRIVGVHGEALKVTVTAPPEKGKANREVTRLLAAAVGAPPAAVEVVRGAAARDKVVRFAGWTAAALQSRLQALL